MRVPPDSPEKTYQFVTRIELERALNPSGESLPARASRVELATIYHPQIHAKGTSLCYSPREIRW